MLRQFAKRSREPICGSWQPRPPSSKAAWFSIAPRHLLLSQQTSVINAIRAHLAEFGVIAPVGRKGVEELLYVVADPNDKRVPEVVRACVAALGSQLNRPGLIGGSNS